MKSGMNTAGSYKANIWQDSISKQHQTGCWKEKAQTFINKQKTHTSTPIKEFVWLVLPD